MVGQILALIRWGEECNVVIEEGTRQALVAEGERLQGVAGISDPELDAMALVLGRQPAPTECGGIRANLDREARRLLAEAKQIW